MRRDGRRGAVLIMVLVLMVTLGAVCALLVAQLVPAAARTRRLLTEQRARDAADSGLAIARARLAADADYKGEEAAVDEGTVVIVVDRSKKDVRTTSTGRVPWRKTHVEYVTPPITIK
jgi:type II secretory pathway component PulK